jgi:hypothetical protein
VLRAVRSRVPAELWSVPAAGGEPAAAALADAAAVGGLLASQPVGDALATEHSVQSLRWRYGFEPLAYRAVTGRRGAQDGVAFFRVRRRGASLEAAVCDVLVPGGDARARGALARAAVRASGADHAVVLGARPPGFLPLPRSGPVLTRREVAGEPVQDLALTLGDVELF